jgi:hypothetical protein
MLVINDVLSDQHLAGTENLAYPRLCYQNAVRGEALTASTTAAGFFEQAPANSLTYESWSPSSLPATLDVTVSGSLPVTYCGIASHTLGTSAATVALQYSTDGTTYVTVDEVGAVDDAPILFMFAKINAQYWRLSISGSTAPSLAVWYLGEALVMERGVYQGYTPIELSRKTIFRPQMSESGQWIGRSIVRKSVSSTMQVNNLSNVWVRRYLEPFIVSALRYPYFFAWHPIPDYAGKSLILDFAEQQYASSRALSSATDGVAYVQTSSDVQPTNSGPRDLMSVSIPMEGLALI